jgi:hypothetical protein
MNGTDPDAVRLPKLTHNRHRTATPSAVISSLVGLFIGTQLTTSVVVQWRKSPSGVDLDRRP